MNCSISGEVPVEPVVSSKSGFLFEKRLIERHISDRGKCPITGEPMTMDEIIPVKSVKSDASGSASRQLSLSTEICELHDVKDPDEPTPRALRGRTYWSRNEDILLISAWLNVAKYPVIETDPHVDSFWSRVVSYYQDGKQESWVDRAVNQCKSRWQKINKAVTKFVGCYQVACNERESGQSEDNVLRNAHQIYRGDVGLDFKFEHAWRELRNDPKWRSFITQNDEKRRKVDEVGGYFIGSNPPTTHDDGDNSPDIEADKRKGKRKKLVEDGSDAEAEDLSALRLTISKLTEHMSALVALKQQELKIKAMKEERKARKARKARENQDMIEMKYNLLSNLIQKSELTQDERELKSSLIQFCKNN